MARTFEQSKLPTDNGRLWSGQGRRTAGFRQVQVCGRNLRIGERKRFRGASLRSGDRDYGGRGIAVALLHHCDEAEMACGVLIGVQPLMSLGMRRRNSGKTKQRKEHCGDCRPGPGAQAIVAGPWVHLHAT